MKEKSNTLKRNLLRAAVVLILLLPFAICFGNGTTDGAKGGKETGTETANAENEWVSLKVGRYSIMHPSDWDPDVSGANGTVFVIFAPLASNSDMFRENMNFMVQSGLGEYGNLDSYTELTESQIRGKVLPNAELIESTRIKTKAGDYQKMIYTGDVQGRHLKFYQHFWVMGGKAYLLTFTVEADIYQEYEDIALRMLDSFEMN